MRAKPYGWMTKQRRNGWQDEFGSPISPRLRGYPAGRRGGCRRVLHRSASLMNLSAVRGTEVDRSSSRTPQSRPTRSPRVLSSSSRPRARKTLVALRLRPIPAPTSRSSLACSKTCVSKPLRASARAAVKPPRPPPMRAMRSFRFMSLVISRVGRLHRGSSGPSARALRGSGCGSLRGSWHEARSSSPQNVAESQESPRWQPLQG